MQVTRSFWIGCTLAALAAGVELEVSAPAVGRVFDLRTHSIRQVAGAPGASLLSSSLAGPFEMAEIAPNGKAAIGVRDGQWFISWDLDRPERDWVEVKAGPLGIERAVWSADSATVALHSPESHAMLLISREGGQYSRIDLDPADGQLQTFTVGSGSRPAVFAATSSGVYLLTPGNPDRRITSLGAVSSLITVHTGRDLVVADTDNQSLYEVRDAAGVAPETIPLANLAPDSRIVGLASSPDEQRVYAADAACRCLQVFDYSSRRRLHSIELSVEPAFLKPFAKSQFQINSPANQSTAFWILDAGDSPMVHFVSAGDVQQ